jgi:hypothetical protein
VFDQDGEDLAGGAVAELAGHQDGGLVAGGGTLGVLADELVEAPEGARPAVVPGVDDPPEVLVHALVPDGDVGLAAVGDPLAGVAVGVGEFAAGEGDDLPAGLLVLVPRVGVVVLPGLNHGLPVVEARLAHDVRGQGVVPVLDGGGEVAAADDRGVRCVAHGVWWGSGPARMPAWRNG